jgi:hypothetical protein
MKGPRFSADFVVLFVFFCMIQACVTPPMPERDLAKLRNTHRITLMSAGVTPDGKLYPRYIVIDSPKEVTRVVSTIRLHPLPPKRVFGDLISRYAEFETGRDKIRMAVSTTRFGPYWMPKEFYQVFESYFHDWKTNSVQPTAQPIRSCQPTPMRSN